MVDCEICGRKPAKHKAVIEGVVMQVCDDCVKFGKEIVEKTKIKPVATVNKPSYKPKVEYDIVEDYAQILKRAIGSKGIKYRDLARQINENESYLRRVIHGDTIPTLKLARKLEKALDVKITEEIE